MHCVFLRFNITVNNWFLLSREKLLALKILARGQVQT